MNSMRIAVVAAVLTCMLAGCTGGREGSLCWLSRPAVRPCPATSDRPLSGEDSKPKVADPSRREARLAVQQAVEKAVRSSERTQKAARDLSPGAPAGRKVEVLCLS